MGIATRAAPGTTADVTARGTAGRRPWWVWTVPFAAVFATLVARNAFLFSTRLYEQGDSGANSILIEQAMRLRLLVGHYSREHFNNPGPAYMYVQALGQGLARHVLHVVPTDWNGQILAVYALDSAFVALIVGIVYGWTRSLRGAAAAFCVLLGCAAARPEVLTSNWMPDLLVLTFAVFLLSAGSIAARQPRDLWILALSGWMCIHGYVPFLLFVPLITVTAVVMALWPDRRRPRAAIRAFFRDRRAAWLPAAVISAVFLLPIVLELILHWPGNFGKYISYSMSHANPGHTAARVTDYVLWFWWPRSGAWLAPVLFYAAALVVMLTLTRGPLRRWFGALIAIAAVTSIAFVYYTAMDVDLLNQQYIGYFFWSVPFILLLVVVTGLIQALPVRTATAVALTASIGGAVAFGAFASLRTNTHDNDPGIPGAVSALAALSHGKPVVITGRGVAWVEIPGFLVQAERTGVRACVDQPGMAYLVSSQFICTAAESAKGHHFAFLGAAAPAGSRVVVRFGTPEFGYATVIRD